MLFGSPVPKHEMKIRWKSLRMSSLKIQLYLHIHGGVKHVAVCFKTGITAALAGHCLDGAEPYTEIITFAGEIFSVFLFELSMEAVIHDDSQKSHIYSTAEMDKLFTLCQIGRAHV